MPVTATRATTIAFTNDVLATINATAAANTASPGSTELLSLASGANTITPPDGGSTPTACTIIPPDPNLDTITLKGVAGDTGVVLHKTDPTTIALDSPTTPFVLTASAAIVGVRLVWS